jgi:hypothetical protein
MCRLIKYVWLCSTIIYNNWESCWSGSFIVPIKVLSFYTWDGMRFDGWLCWRIASRNARHVKYSFTYLLLVVVLINLVLNSLTFSRLSETSSVYVSIVPQSQIIVYPRLLVWRTEWNDTIQCAKLSQRCVIVRVFPRSASVMRRHNGCYRSTETFCACLDESCWLLTSYTQY